MASNPAIHELIKKNVSIPTLPQVVTRINQMIANPDAGTAEIGALVSEDAPMAAKVLKIANSAYYGLAGQCVSTEHASTVLGVRVLKNIVTQVAVISQFEHLNGIDGFSIESLWKHATFTGHLCSKLARISANVRGDMTPEEFYVCGLLHDVGKVVLLDGMGPKYVDIVRRARSEQIPLYRAERDELGFTHSEVGSVVATRWDLPDRVIGAIQHHHGPREEVSGSVIVSLVAHANLLAHRVEDGHENPADIFDTETRAQLGLSQPDIVELLEFAAQRLGEEL